MKPIIYRSYGTNVYQVVEGENRSYWGLDYNPSNSEDFFWRRIDQKTEYKNFTGRLSPNADSWILCSPDEVPEYLLIAVLGTAALAQLKTTLRIPI